MAESAVAWQGAGMTPDRADPLETTETLAAFPARVTQARGETLEDVAFLSGAALCRLHVVLARVETPGTLLRDRLALRAAEACVAFSGRPERAADLRDAVHLLRPGDLPGPAGETALSWRRAVERPVSAAGMQRALPSLESTRLAAWLDTGSGAPVSRAARVFEAVLTEAPRAEVAALTLADAALARALGWDRVVPLLAPGLGRADLRRRGEDLRLACHRALAESAAEAVRLAGDLGRRTAHLSAVAPKLRAKGAGEAVAMFRTRDAVAASALPLPDRAARRLCDRLVDLGAVRELTGRETFRLYGV